MRKALIFFILISAIMILLVVRVVQAEGPPSTGEASTEDASKRDLQELTRELANPISDVWNIVFQDNNYILQGVPSDNTRYQNVLNFQPVLPIHLTKVMHIEVLDVIKLKQKCSHIF